MATNEYFDNATQTALPKGATARAEAVDNKFDAITTGLDLLPTSADFNQSTHNYGTDTGAVDAHDVADLAHITGALVDGQEVEFKAVATSLTTTPTLDVSTGSGGAVIIVYPDNSALSIGDIVLNGNVKLRYNSSFTRWVLLSSTPQASASAASAAAAAADAVLTAADAVSTDSDATATAADAVSTAADAVSTAADLAAMTGYGTVTSSTAPAFDLTGNQTQEITALTHNPTPTLSNKAAGESITVLITASGADRTITYNGSWTQLGSLPTTIPSGKTLMLSFVSTTTLDTGVYVTGVLEL